MDEADGQVKSLRIWLEEREVSYVPATSLGHDVFTPDGRNGRANEMIAAPPKQRPRIFAAPVFLCAGADFHRLDARTWTLAACETPSSSATS